MKKLSSLVCFVLATTLLIFTVACAGVPTEAPISSETAKPQQTVEKTPEPEPTPEPTPQPTPEPVEDAVLQETGGMSDDPYDFQLMLNGTLYTFPMPYSDFVATGWEPWKATIESLKPSQYDSLTFDNGTAKLLVYIFNLSDDVVPLNECQIGGIKIDTDKVTASLAKGITFGSSTYDDIIAAYSDPSEKYDGSDFSSLTYATGSYSLLKFMTNKTDKKISNIEIKNFVKSENKPDSTASTGDVPAVVSQYEAPKVLGDDPYSFHVKYNGVLYRLPVPVSELLNNGFKLTNKPYDSVRAGDYKTGFDFMANNQKLTTALMNYSDQGAPPEHCFVTELKYDYLATKLPMELPKGITEKSSQADIKAAYGEPKEKSTSSMFETWEYQEDSVFSSIVFYFDIETKEIKIIKVINAPKKLK